MNILVIGGSKFIGWHLMEALVEAKHSVAVINRGNHTRTYPLNVAHHIADRNDYAKMAAIIGSNFYDVVFDMCGFVEGDMQHTVELFGGRTKKYVFISSAATYLEPLTMPISEDCAQGAHGTWGAYGSGKLACEQVLLSAFEAKGFPAVIVRPSYVYGPGNKIDRETFLFDRVVNDRVVIMPGGGEAIIQMGEVNDLCKALLKLAEGPDGVGECYNISSNEFVTLNSLVRIVASIVGKSVQTISIDPKKFGMTDRDVFPFDNSTYFTSCEKFSRTFEWSSEITLTDGLTTTYAHWQNSAQKPQTNYANEDAVLAAILSLSRSSSNEV